MFYFILSAAVILFIAHVVLLLRSFHGTALDSKRYFYSHLTLWLTGIVVFALAWLYHSTGKSGFLDYFDSTQKLCYILIFTAALSAVAHCIVKFVVAPLLYKKA